MAVGEPRGTTDDLVIRSMRRFLASDTAACHFVAQFSKDGRGIWWAKVEGPPDADSLSGILAEAEQNAELGAIVFPDFRTESDIRELLKMLSGASPWSVVQEDGEWGELAFEQFDVSWTSEGYGEACSALGMAPLLSMPPTRRAPFVSLFVWPGPRRNNHRRKKSAVIGIGDMAPAEMDEGKYKDLSGRTRERARSLNGGSLNPAATFFLPKQP